MTFIWPIMLLALVLVPILAFVYIFTRTGVYQQQPTLRSLGFTGEGSEGQQTHQRHIPPAIYLAGITLLLLALSRPEMVIRLPRLEGTIMLAFDVSNSMLAEDFEPTRLEAAKAAAINFVENQPNSVRIGVVAFSNGGLAVQPPTDIQADVIAAIERLTPIGATSLGQGIFVSINSLAIAADPSKQAAEQEFEFVPVDPEEPIETEDIPPGLIPSSAIVILSDGENTADPNPLELAELAAERGVAIHTIGVGSPEGIVLEVEGFSVFTALNEAQLQEISRLTDGIYYNAQSEAELQQVYNELDPRLIVRGERVEITAFLAVIAVLMLLTGATLSLLWYGKAP
ncbi:MAG: VWA domain-containing protein [Chloroflexota bacterium]